MSSPHYLKVHTTAAVRDLLRRACTASDQCTMTDFVLASTRGRVAADLALADAVGDAVNHVQIQIINHLSDTEFADLQRCAAARHQSVSQYMEQAALDDARQMTDV